MKATTIRWVLSLFLALPSGLVFAKSREARCDIDFDEIAGQLPKLDHVYKDQTTRRYVKDRISETCQTPCGPRQAEFLLNLAKPTRPSSKKPLAVKGKRTKIEKSLDDVRKLTLTKENEAADTLAKAGYRVMQNPKRSNRAYYDSVCKKARLACNKKDPDLIVEGQIFDVFTPINPNSRGIRKRILEKADENQTRRVVVNMTAAKGGTNEAAYNSAEYLEKLRTELRKANNQKLEEVIAIVGEGDASKIIRIYP
jgi:hypothetical protein